MKVLLTLTAAALTTAALSLPAAATTVGCKVSEPNASVKATDCRTQRSARITSMRGSRALAYAPRSRTTILRQGRSISPSDDEGVKGGAAN
jgi:hypothetical protein